MTETIKATAKNVELTPQLNLQIARLYLIGDAPLITHRFPDKARKQMLEKQTKRATAGKEAKNPEEDFHQSLYPLPDGSGYGFPAVGFKAAGVSACRSLEFTMTQAKQAFHVIGDPDNDNLVPIQAPAPRMREDIVRLANGVCDIRFRGEFWPWWVQLNVRFNANVFSPEQLVMIYNTAGFGVGVGEWRPEKAASGSYGLFHVATDEEVTELLTGRAA